jgi:23S rRNA (adenine2503-C2)-methyltransferase
MDKPDIKELSFTKLEDELARLGEEPYRARQLFGWLYKRGAFSFDDMTDLPDGTRKALKSNFRISVCKMLDSKRSRLDGTTKYLLGLDDGNAIEAVFLPDRRRATACISSQVGCKYACTFCASARLGFIRNLAHSEIINEVLFLRFKNSIPPITNIVFMGIGEPMDNYDNVIKAIRIFNDKDGLNIGSRRITISTCGIIPGIEKLSREGLQVELSVSLHSADDTVRSTLVPVNKKYPLKELMKACKCYTDRTNRVVTFEYVLIKEINDFKEDAIRLANLLKGMKCKVNAISYNPASGEGPRSGTPGVSGFTEILRRRGINATHRRSRGADIDAGCGQLRISHGR